MLVENQMDWGEGRVDVCRRGGDAGVCMHVCVLALGCE